MATGTNYGKPMNLKMLAEEGGFEPPIQVLARITV